MKLLIVTQYYYPEQFQINEIAPELVRRGHEVTVLCGTPNYPKGEIYDGYDNPNMMEETLNGVRVIRCKQIPRGHNPINLIRNYISFVHESKKKVKELPADFDVVLGYQLSPITSMIAAMEYKKMHNVPLIYYTLDLWPVSAEGMLKSKCNPLYYPIARWSKSIYQAADRIIVTSKPFISYLNKVNDIPVEKMSYLPQHAGVEMINSDLEAEDNGVADFMYAGNLGKGQRVDVIIEAARLLGARHDYRIHLVGDGRMKPELESMVKKYGLQDNVVFYGNQKRQDMPSFYKKADVLLITLRGNNEVGDTMPGKLQMYMTTGKTIMGAINGAANEVIKEARCGTCVRAGDYIGLSELMQFYIEHPRDYDQCGKNARDYFLKNFTLDKFVCELESRLKHILHK